MVLNETQILNVNALIEKGKILEYHLANQRVEIAVNEWLNKEKTDKEAYDKIYKKVIKNEHHLAARYTHIDNDKRINILAELFAEDLIAMLDFEELDEPIKQSIYRINGITK